MSDIHVEKPDEGKLEEMGVRNWPVWEKETSRFDWYYDSGETCYLLKGKVTVTPENAEPVTFGAGDLVVFPKGMKCVWNITEDVRKHYSFG